MFQDSLRGAQALPALNFTSKQCRGCLWKFFALWTRKGSFHMARCTSYLVLYARAIIFCIFPGNILHSCFSNPIPTSCAVEKLLLSLKQIEGAGMWKLQVFYFSVNPLLEIIF